VVSTGLSPQLQAMTRENWRWLYHLVPK
jgi:hypothetical protein